MGEGETKKLDFKKDVGGATKGVLLLKGFGGGKITTGGGNFFQFPSQGTLHLLGRGKRGAPQ